MDFEAIWHTHRSFVIRVLAGAIAFLVLNGVRASLEASAGQAARRSANAQAALLDDVAALEGTEGLEKGRSVALADRLEPSLARGLLWRADAEFLLPEGDASPALFYASALAKAGSDVERRAARWNAQVPKGAAGLGLPEEVEPDGVPEALARADVVRRLVLALLDAGVRNLDTVAPEEIDYEERGDGKYLRVLPVRVRFQADLGRVDRVLSGLWAEGSFLEVAGCELIRADGADGSLSAELTLQALSVVEQAPARASARTGGRRGSGSRGGGRLRRFGRER